MSTVRIRAVAASDTGHYFIPENSLVFIHKAKSTIHVTDDQTTATLAYHKPKNTSDYKCIGVAITTVDTRNTAFGARMFTYVAYGPQLVHCPRPDTFVGNSLQWNLDAGGAVVLKTRELKTERFVGVLLELCDNDHVRIMVSPINV